jgi:hypothetical protein
VSDERLEWLNTTFPSYIDDIQQNSANVGLKGLANETAHALQFTSRSTYMCIKFLLNEAGFYYVLPRSFSSDPIEGTYVFTYSIKRWFVVESSSSSNTAENIDFISQVKIASKSYGECVTKNSEELILPIDVRTSIHSLSLILSNKA